MDIGKHVDSSQQRVRSSLGDSPDAFFIYIREKS